MTSVNPGHNLEMNKILSKLLKIVNNKYFIEYLIYNIIKITSLDTTTIKLPKHINIPEVDKNRIIFEFLSACILLPNIDIKQTLF